MGDVQVGEEGLVTITAKSFMIVFFLMMAGTVLLAGFSFIYYGQQLEERDDNISALEDQVESLGEEPVIDSTPNGGDKGDQGDRGERGPRGDTGDRGSPGKTGATGAVGPPGAQGGAGPEGPEGPPGDPGEEGPQGEVGPAGPVGEAGATGPPGQDGRTPTSFTFTFLASTYRCTDDNRDGHYECVAS